jgi:hypothetical protein
VLWRDLDCAPHPGQAVGYRLSTVTVQACSRRSTLTTFKPAAGNHAINVFITVAAAYRGNMPVPGGVGPRVACTKSHVWMPPFAQGVLRMAGRVIGCGHVSGLGCGCYMPRAGMEMRGPGAEQSGELLSSKALIAFQVRI